MFVFKWTELHRSVGQFQINWVLEVLRGGKKSEKIFKRNYGKKNNLTDLVENTNLQFEEAQQTANRINWDLNPCHSQTAEKQRYKVLQVARKKWHVLEESNSAYHTFLIRNHKGLKPYNVRKGKKKKKKTLSIQNYVFNENILQKWSEIKIFSHKGKLREFVSRSLYHKKCHKFFKLKRKTPEANSNLLKLMNSIRKSNM